MDGMALQRDLITLLEKYKTDMAAFVFGVTYKDVEGNIAVLSNTIIPIPCRDHEESMLRDKCARDVGELTFKLTETVYVGR
jgi:hypothetical protein